MQTARRQPAAEMAPQVITASVIAALLGVPRSRIAAVLRTRPHIAPDYRADHVRLYRRSAIDLVRQELAAIDARRDAGDDDGTLFDADVELTRREGGEHR